MYGDLFKKLRKRKGCTQKEIYTGVVSKTFYSDFEAGKYSVEITKFEGLLSNLGISYEEFDYFKNQQDPKEAIILERKIDALYKNGKFEELYEIYTLYCRHQDVNLRYLDINAYLLVLITNANFYKFSREPFNEIVANLENAKMWTLKEIKLSKLVLLSLSEHQKERSSRLYTRILGELEKYQSYNPSVYYEEISDLFFNRIQSLLITNELENAQTTLNKYTEMITPSDNLHFLLQHKFITYLLNLYLDFPNYHLKLKDFIQQLDDLVSSEKNFYKIIIEIHSGKARNYYQRYVEKGLLFKEGNEEG